MSLATLIASIAIILDSQVLVIGAMVLGPEFGPSPRSVWHWSDGELALLGEPPTLLVGFAVSIIVATLCRAVRPGLGLGGGCDGRRRRVPRPTSSTHRTSGRYRRHHRGGRRGAVADVGQSRWALRGVHLGDHRAGRGQRRMGWPSGPGTRSGAAALQLLLNLSGDGAGRLGTLALQQAVWVRWGRHAGRGWFERLRKGTQAPRR